jgi:transposase
MPHRYPEEVHRQVIELARSGTKVAQLAATFGMSDATIYNWLKQDKGRLRPTPAANASARPARLGPRSAAKVLLAESHRGRETFATPRSTRSARRFVNQCCGLLVGRDTLGLG